MHFTRSAFVPDRISSPFAMTGGYCQLSCLKNSSIFPPLICIFCIYIYIYQDNCTCILQSFDSDLADWILVFDALNFAGLFLLDQESNNFAENSYFTELIMLFCSTFFNLPDGWHYIARHYILSNQFNKLIRFIWFNRVS